jgi:EmrB/QacA subfamily drug resistance transporter
MADTAGRDIRTPEQRRRTMVVFVGLMLGMMLATLDTTMVATALPTIVGDLGGVTLLSWVATIYLMAQMASTPLYGKLGDLFGRKRMFQAAVVIFMVGSGLCGLARSMIQLIAFRGIQGIGAGGLTTLALAITADIIPARQLGRYVGYSGLSFAIAAVAGPLLGGLLVDHLSWHWAFYLNIPFGVLSLLVIGLRLDVAYKRVPHALDYAGSVLLVTSLACVALVTSWGGNRYPWVSAPVIGTGGLAVIAALAFVVRERQAPEPVLPLRLLSNRIVSISAGINLLGNFTFFGAIFFLPVFFQEVRGFTASQSGLLVIPFMLGSVLGMVVSGELATRTGRYRRLILLGGVVGLVGAVLLAFVDAGSSTIAVCILPMPSGFGLGLCVQLLILVAQNAVEPRDLGVSTSTVTLSRYLGAALGVAVLDSVFNARLRSGIDRLVPGGRGAVDLASITSNRAQHLRPDVAEGVRLAFGHAVHGALLLLIPAAVIILLLSLGLRELPLRDSAQMRLAEHAEDGG